VVGNLERKATNLTIRQLLLIGLLGVAVGLAWHGGRSAPAGDGGVLAQGSPLLSPLNPVSVLLVEEGRVLSMGSLLARSQVILPVVLVTLLFMLVTVALAARWRS
jgi:hypothetical protein